MAISIFGLNKKNNNKTATDAQLERDAKKLLGDSFQHLASIIPGYYSNQPVASAKSQNTPKP